MTDYIRRIIAILRSNSIDTLNYDDDKTYFDGHDDVFVLYVGDTLTLKFAQNYFNKNYENFMLFYKGKSISGYDNVYNELKNVLKLIH